MTSFNLATLTRDDLRARLQQLAGQHADRDSFNDALAQELPGVCASITYDGAHFSGKAMSPFHPGVLSF